MQEVRHSTELFSLFDLISLGVCGITITGLHNKSSHLLKRIPL